MMVRLTQAACLLGLFSKVVFAEMDCGGDLTVSTTDEVKELRELCSKTYEGSVDFNMTEPGGILIFDWEKGGEAVVRGDNLTFVLGGPETTNITLGRLSIWDSVSEFRLGEALTTLVIEDLSITGKEALEDGEEDPCDYIVREIRDSGAIIYMIGCGMKPTLKIDGFESLEASGSVMARQWQVAVGLGLLTSIALAI